MVIFFFFKQKTAYDMRISDWSSDVCSSDLDPSLQIVHRRLLRASRRDLCRGRGAEGRVRLLPGLRWRQQTVPCAFARTGLRPSRPEERGVGKECGSTCRTGWWTYH